jgi:hypothetical protein
MEDLDMGFLIGFLLRLITSHYIHSDGEQQSRERLMREGSKQDVRDRLARKLTEEEESSKQEIRDKVARKLAAMRESSRQDRRDELAGNFASRGEGRFISDILSGGNTSPFALYLRPFALEERIR